MMEKPYTTEFLAEVESRIPSKVVAAMESEGWNATVVYEIVKDVKSEFISAEKPLRRLNYDCPLAPNGFDHISFANRAADHYHCKFCGRVTKDYGHP
jgi:hypothetical protein